MTDDTTSPARIEPWHDTTRCMKCNGPVVPLSTPPQVYVADVRCAACGKKWIEKDPAKLARIWWSAGAHEGRLRQQELTEKERSADAAVVEAAARWIDLGAYEDELDEAHNELRRAIELRAVANRRKK